MPEPHGERLTMAEVTDLSAVRRSRTLAKVDGTRPTITMEGWTDPADPRRPIASTMSVHESLIGSPEAARNTAFLFAATATQSMVSLSETDTDGAWAAEPVVHGVVTRGGYATTTPDLFWHREAHATFRHRLRCAWWVAGQLRGIVWPAAVNLILLVISPGRLRALEVDDGKRV
jgi:hypothetical protein